MGTNYALLKRSTLKELLEARGTVASNKVILIAELMEGDRAAAAAAPPREEEPTEFEKEYRSRMALLPPALYDQMADRVFGDVQEYIMLRRSQMNQQTGERATTPVNILPGKAKIPYQAFKSYSEAEGEVDDYLQDFERLCQLHNISAEDRVPLLAGRLSGRAAEAYRAIPDEDSTNYAKVKQAILARYVITSEAYRLKFRDIKKLARDTHTEWAHRLQRAAKGWLEATQVNTLEDLFQLMVMEQFFDGIPAHLQNWVRDRKLRQYLTLCILLTGDVDAVVNVTGITGRSVLLEVNPPPPETSLITWIFSAQTVAVSLPSLRCYDNLIGKCQLYVNGSLRIDSVNSTNEGSYTLTVVPDSSPPETTEYRLRVYAPLDKPVLRIRSDSMYVVSGTNVTLLCDAGGQTVTTYTFYRDQTPICTGPNVSCSGSSLDFTPISEIYNGSYTCRNENPVSSNLSDPINVTVSFRISDISLTVNTSGVVWPGLDSVSLRCSARGTNVSYSWSLDGAALPAEPHYVLSADRSVLTISPVSSKDNGSFTCTAANSINNLTSPEVLLHLGCE
ncbi:uncharacterized protein LOC120986769 [Bufo bufo]|uniref:uncharacterized protein LOC120986769 n=1 Tax=Bufo bufo TaxID=8384 RepID=UPI001ABE3F47|nr:uncharacterized protein LOC120986769 [Bufo bufo]